MKEEQTKSKIKKKRKVVKQKKSQERSQLIETSEKIQSIELSKSHTDETPSFELITEFDSDKPNEIIPILSQIPIDVTEIIVSDNTTSLAPNQPDQFHAASICQPHTLHVTQEVVPNESEQLTSFELSSTKRKSKLVLSENIPVEVCAADVIGNTGALTIASIGSSVQILPEVQPNLSIVMKEVVINENVKQFEIKPQNVSNASISCALFEVPSIVDEFVADKEDDFSPAKTKQEHAKANITPVEAIEMVKIDQNEKEVDFSHAESMASIALCKIPSNKYVEVTQTFAEYMPDKYYPEIVVATEVASTSLVEHKSYEAFEMSASEITDEYTSDKKPIGQIATAEIIKSESIKVEHTESNEDARSIHDMTLPQSVHATGSFEAHEGMQRQITDYLEAIGPVTDVLIYDTKYANIEYTDQISKITEMVNVTETEQELKENEISNLTTAQMIYSLQESFSQSQPISHEHESDSVADIRPRSSTATTQYVPYQGIQAEYTEIIDTVAKIEQLKRPQMSEANIALEHETHTEGFDIITNEREGDFIAKPIPAQIRPSVTSNMHTSVIVQSTQAIESEHIYNVLKYETHVPTIVPGDTIKVGIHEEVNTVQSLDKLFEKPVKMLQAQQVIDFLNGTIISNVVANEIIGDHVHESQSNLHCTAAAIINTRNALEINAPDVNNLDECIEEYNKLEQAAINKSYVMDSQMHKSVTIEQVEPLEETGALELKESNCTFVTKIIEGEQNETIITESVLMETASPISDMVISKSHSKAVFDEEHSINVSEMKCLDNEMPLDSHISSVEHVATVVLSENICHHIQTEVCNELLQSVDLQRMIEKSTQAEVVHSSLHEILSEEIVAYEKPKAVEIISYQTAVGKPSLEGLGLVIITEQNVQESVNALIENLPTEQRMRDFKIAHALLAPNVSETQHEINNGILDEQRPYSAAAQTVNDERKYVQGSENFPLEVLSELDRGIISAGKANINFDELSSVIGCTPIVWEIGKNVEELHRQNEVANQTPSHCLKAAQTDQNQPLYMADAFDKQSANKKYAKSKQEAHTEITSSDFMVFDSLQTEEHLLEPNRALAARKFQPSEHLITTVNIAHEQHETLASIRPTFEHNTQPSAHYLKSAVTDEVFMNEGYVDLPDADVTKQLVKSSVDAFNQIDVTESVSLTEVDTQEQRTQHGFEGVKECILLTETEPFEMEGIFDVSKPDSVVSQSNISEQHRLNEHFEPNIFENVENLLITLPLQKGKLIVIPNTSLQVHEPDNSEIIQAADGYIQPKSCQANINVSSMISVVGTSFQTNEEVSQLKPIDSKIDRVEKIGEETADQDYSRKSTFDYNTTNCIQISEVNPIDATNERTELEKNPKQAVATLQEMFSVPIKSQIDINEQLVALPSDKQIYHSARPTATVTYTEKYISETTIFESIYNTSAEETSFAKIAKTTRELENKLNSAIEENIALTETHFSTHNIQIIGIETNQLNKDVSSKKGRCLVISRTNSNEEK